MTMPTIGVFIPTPGRKSLVRTVHSIKTQRLIPGDDILIVGDGHDEWTHNYIKSVGPPFRYIAIPQTRDWGHSQDNYGMQNVGGDVIVAQDDDDIFAPRAFEEIRQAVIQYPNRPIMARVKTPFLGVLWTQPAVPPFDGHCLIIPNNKEKLGYWGPQYDGDQDYMRTSVEPYSGCGWLDKVLSITRPTWKLWPYPVEYSDIPILRIIRNSCREFMTKNTSLISAGEQEEWWTNLDQENNWYWIFYNETFTEPVGFVGLNRREDKMFATYGLLPRWRGKGLGAELVEFSQWAAQDELTIEVRTDNIRAVKLYQKMGFREHWSLNGIMEMWSPWPPPEKQ